MANFRYVSLEEAAAEIKAIRARQAERDAARTAEADRIEQQAIKAEQAARAAKAAAAEKQAPDPGAVPLTFVSGNRMADWQVAEWVASYRAKYANGDPAIEKLAEARLVAALQADGYSVPPKTEPGSAERLLALRIKELRAKGG